MPDMTEATAPVPADGPVLCRCGNPDNCACPPDGLRARLTAVVTRWALMYPLGNYGIWGTAGASRDQLAGIAEDIAAAWGRDIADRVLTELAGDPGDLPARMAEAMRVALVTWSEGAQNEHLAKTAMSVRWAHAAHLAARVGDAERRAEHAESEHQVTQDRLADLHAHRVTLMKALEDENNLRVRTEVERDALKTARCPSCDHLAEQHARTEETDG